MLWVMPALPVVVLDGFAQKANLTTEEQGFSRIYKLENGLV